MSGSCPRRSREHARKESEGGRIAEVASASCNAAGWARVKGEAVGVLAIRKFCGQSAGSGERKRHCSRCSGFWRMPVAGALGRACHAWGNGVVSQRSRAGMARTRQRASYAVATVAYRCQSDLSAGGRAAAFWRSASGRRCRIVELRQSATDRGRYCRSDGRRACRAGTGSRCGRSSLTDVDAW